MLIFATVREKVNGKGDVSHQAAIAIGDQLFNVGDPRGYSSCARALREAKGVEALILKRVRDTIRNVAGVHMGSSAAPLMPEHLGRPQNGVQLLQPTRPKGAPVDHKAANAWQSQKKAPARVLALADEEL